jgi:hypothetical protein
MTLTKTGMECFFGGQVWAVYDTLDAMPRFYAQIKKVMSPGFNLQITWLEAHPDDHDDFEWVKEGLPVACGKFRYGKSQYSDKRLMFSHPIDLEEGGQRDTCKIFPRKGETWPSSRIGISNGNLMQIVIRSMIVSLLRYCLNMLRVLVHMLPFLGKVKGFLSLFLSNLKGRDGRV